VYHIIKVYHQSVEMIPQLISPHKREMKTVGHNLFKGLLMFEKELGIYML